MPVPTHRRNFAAFLRSTGWVLAVAVGSLLGGPSLWALPSSLRHPQDGPHADLRFDLRADAFVADISMNLTFLDGMMETGREQPDRFEPSELRQLKSALRDRMAQVCAVTADGKALVPSLEELAMNEPDESLLPLFPRSGMRGLRKIRFQLVYPLASAPTSLAIVWSFFPPDELSTLDPKPPLVLAAELTAQGVRSQLEFSQAEPEQIWHATAGGLDARLLAVPAPAERKDWYLSLPAVVSGVAALGFAGAGLLRNERRGRRLLAAVLLGGAALGLTAVPVGRVRLAAVGSGANLPAAEDAKAIFRPLHANLYRAFDFTDERSIYDALARSVDGALLEDLYLTIHRSLVVQEEGGAMSRVRAVREVDLAVDAIGLVPASTGRTGTDAPAGEVPGFVITCRYQVDGRVTHWGHSHDRTNEYLARYTVVARPEGWRIAETEVLEQSRVDQPDAPPPSDPKQRDDGSFEV